MKKMKKRIETLIKLGIFAAGVMYAVNKVIEQTSLVRHLLISNEGDFFRWSHGSVFYKKIGTGSPLLLIHNLDASSSMYEWNEVSSTLAKNHTVYMVDLPGCGRSSKLKGETYINYLYVRFLKEFIDEVIKEKTDVIATGLSASFITMTASIHEGIIGHITMVNPIHPSKLAEVPNYKCKMIKALFDCPILGTFLYNIDYSLQQVEYNFSEKYFFNPFNLNTRTLHSYYEAAHIHSGRGRHLLASIQSNYVNVNIANAFRKLKNPVTMIFGKEMTNAESVSEAYAKLNPSIKSIFIAKTKFYPQMETPEKFCHYCE